MNQESAEFFNNRIIVIDDDSGIRETYRNILTPDSMDGYLAEGVALFGELANDDTGKHGNQTPAFELTLADRGEKGVEEVMDAVSRLEPFALAFIDMKMPGIDGAETAKRIWKLDADIKVVIVTAFSEYEPEDIVRITGRNDCFYLRKPFNPEEILQFARALTHEWSLEKEREILTYNLKIANASLEELNQNLNERVDQQTAMLIQSEKMASIGILAAGVAHEINNPISFINGNLATMAKYGARLSELCERYSALEKDLIKKGDTIEITGRIQELLEFKKSRKIDFILGDINELVKESLEGAERIRKIVLDLRTFSRVDEAEYKFADIHEIIDATLNIIYNETKYGIRIIKNYNEISQIKCFPQKLSQVFMNLLINSIQAIAGDGEIEIRTEKVNAGRRRDDEWVRVIIRDNGCGIEQKNLKKLFDPFFTTKPVGEGTGLGLSIAYDIIKAHGGEIIVTSTVGQGTTFRILLPVEGEI